MKRFILCAICGAFSLLIFAGCSAKLPTNEHKALLEISSASWAAEDAERDYYAGNLWKVYYDGAVEYCERYNLSGIVNRREWSLDERQLSKLYNSLNSGFLRYTEDYYSAADGTGYTYTYFDETGAVVHEFVGYIYTNRTMTKILDIVDAGRETAETTANEPAGAFYAPPFNLSEEQQTEMKELKASAAHCAFMRGIKCGL